MSTSQIPVHVDGADEDAQRSLELRGLVHALLRFLWLIILCALLCGLAGWAYVRRLPTLYQSTAVIEIQPNDQAIALKDRDEEFKDPEAIETTIQNFRHRALMERVAQTLHLGNDPAFLGFTPDKPVPPEAITDRLLGGSSASRRTNTRLIDVTFVHPNPTVARQVTNALVYQFIEQGKQEHLDAIREQNKLLTAKYEELKNRLTKSEGDLQEYKRNHLNESLEAVSVEERRNYVEDKLREMNSALLAVSNERRGMEADLALIKAANDDPRKLLGIASITQDPQVLAAQAQFTKAQGDLATLLERYGEKHPKIIEQREQVESSRAALFQAARLAPSHFDARYNADLGKEENLQTAVKAQENAMLDLEKRLIPYRELVREVDSDRTLTEAVLQKLKESTLALGGGDQPGKNNDASGNFHVVEPAVAAVSLANRRLFIVVGIACAGAMAAAGLVAGLYFLNSSIRTVDVAERLLQLPVLATVPIMPKSAEPGAMLALVHRPNTAEAESFRTLRCSLSLLGPKNTSRVILLTSAVPGEGKSLMAANTAIAFALQGYKTLLLEADLRKPSLATKLMGMDPALPGLGDYMAGQPAPVTTTAIANLSLLPAGTRIDNPAELLSSAEFDELVQWMKMNFDRIVIDTAPVNIVSDTLNIVACASVVCLVVRSNSTSRRMVQRAIELLRRSGVRPDGIILNYMPRWKGIDNHYDYSSSSMYGSSKTYGEAYATTGLGAAASSKKP